MRILQATVANDKGGLTGYIINNYRRIDRDKIQFDFITYDDQLDFSAEVLGLGANLFQLPRPSRWFSYFFGLRKLQRKNQYYCIHFHLSYANLAPLLAAKLAGFQRVIVHSHSTGFDEKSCLTQGLKMLLHSIGKMLMPWLATDYFACSRLAAEWMFSRSIMEHKRYRILHNAILLSRFKFNEKERIRLREMLKIPSDCICVGHVGRFTYQKNHEYLMQVFRDFYKRCPNSILMLVGDGPNRRLIENMAEQFGLTEYVLFLGNRDDVASLYQAMDVLVMPSRFEGLCIVAIEAQMAGLACICSDRLTMETKVTESYVSIPLEVGSEVWVEEILRHSREQRRDQTEALRAAGYDSYQEIKRLESLYQKIYMDVVEKTKLRIS